MSSIRSYIETRKKIVEEQKVFLNQKKARIDSDIFAITERQKTFNESIDVTYELFSPKPMSSAGNRESIQVLEVKKRELMQEKRNIDEQLNKLSDEENEIQESLIDLDKMEKLIKKVVAEYK